MLPKIILPIVLCLAAATLWAQMPAGNCALTNATLIDANHRTPTLHQTILISGGTIKAIFNDGSRSIPDSFTIIPLNGKYLLPGLIDAHVHLATDPSGVNNRSATLDVLKRMLYSGVTTVRDMAGDARTLASLSRDAAAGEIASPDIYYSALMAGPSFFTDPRTAASSAGSQPGILPFMRAVSDTTNLTLAVVEAKGTGATGLKLYAELSAPLVQKIVSEARAQHILVWSHAWVQKANPSDLVKAGVNVISHAPLLIHEKWDTIPAAWKTGTHDSLFWNRVTPDLSSLFILMKQHHTILDATLLTYKQWAADDSTMRYDYEIAKRFTKEAYTAGVTIDAGTDTDQKDFVQKEMELLVTDAGFSPIDAIIAGTLNSAKTMGIEANRGTIEEGRKADLLIVTNNPLQDISNIESVFLVMKDGRLYKN